MAAPPADSSSAPASAPAAAPPQPPSPETVFRSLSTYPFHSDPEWQTGLAAILGHPDTPATPEELQGNEALILQAQCFYFSRKYNVPVDPNAYSAWLASQPSAPAPPATSAPAEPTAAPSSLSSSTETTHAQPSSEQEPPYPTTFAHIVDLITRNIPVPGIEEIPTTVLEPGSSKVDRTPRRRKPWEKDDDDNDNDDGDAGTKPEDAAAQQEQGTEQGESAPVDINGHRETGVGVVRMLQPNAVAPSGLLAPE